MCACRSVASNRASKSCASTNRNSMIVFATTLLVDDRPSSSTCSVGSIEEGSTKADSGGGGLQRVSVADDASVKVAVPDGPDGAKLAVESGVAHWPLSTRPHGGPHRSLRERAGGSALCLALVSG